MALRFVVIAAVGAFAIAPDAHSSTSSKAIRSDKKATQIVSPNGMVSEEHVGPASLVDKSHGEVAETQDHHKASDDQKEQNSKLSRGTNICRCVSQTSLRLTGEASRTGTSGPPLAGCSV